MDSTPIHSHRGPPSPHAEPTWVPRARVSILRPPAPERRAINTEQLGVVYNDDIDNDSDDDNNNNSDSVDNDNDSDNDNEDEDEDGDYDNDDDDGDYDDDADVIE